MAAIITDLSTDNGWIPVEKSPDVLSRVTQTSAVEAVARKVVMSSEFLAVPRFAAEGVDIVPEHATIPLVDADLDDVTLQAFKFANRFGISVEDREDAVADALLAYQAAWTSNFAVKLDNACLGVTGTGGPFESVYRAVGSGNRTATAGALTLDTLAGVFSGLESGDFGGNNVVIAHPALAMALRNLKDSDGMRVVADPLGAGVPTVFGAQLVFSKGARTSAAVTDRPTGNPLLIVSNKDNLILGVRSGPEALISTEARWETDEVELKMRARRGFVLADASAARVIELTAAV
jgi:HK97 family phage major capsid protein